MSNNVPISRADTPEEYFTPKPNPEKEVPVDALLCSLARASTVLMLLTENGADLRSGFTLNHSTIMDSLYLLESTIDQTSRMFEHSVGIGEVKT